MASSRSTMPLSDTEMLRNARYLRRDSAAQSSAAAAARVGILKPDLILLLHISLMGRKDRFPLKWTSSTVTGVSG